MKYSLKQHLLGITDEEYTVVDNVEPPLEDELTEQKAEFVDTKEKSSGLFSAVVAQLVEMEQKIPADRDRVVGIVNRAFGDEAEGDPSIRRRGQRARRRLKADGYKGDRLNAAGRPSEEQEEQRMSPRGMNYKFDERPPAKGANRLKSLPTGKSGRGNRVVNNSLYRPKTKDEFVKDKASSAFKEGEVGGIFAAAFSMIKEDNYPDDIRNYDSDPRSPFYSGDDGAEPNVEMYVQDNAEGLAEQLWNSIEYNWSGDILNMDSTNEAEGRFKTWLDTELSNYDDGGGNDYNEPDNDYAEQDYQH